MTGAEAADWIDSRSERPPRALCAQSDWAFGVGFHRLELMHSVHNQASCRVAHIASYELEGNQASGGLHCDGGHDMHLHARLSSDR